MFEEYGAWESTVDAFWNLSVRSVGGARRSHGRNDDIIVAASIKRSNSPGNAPLSIAIHTARVLPTFHSRWRSIWFYSSENDGNIEAV